MGRRASAALAAFLLSPWSGDLSAQGLVRRVEGSFAGARFGAALDAAQDVDGDGFADLVTGSPLDGSALQGGGAVGVFSGATGVALFFVTGEQTGEHLGASVAGPGDLDGDGFADFAAGAPDFSPALKPGAGRLLVWSGKSGASLFQTVGDDAYDGFGYAVGGAGDVDADGFPDLLAGAPGDDDGAPNGGSVRVISGATGLTLFTFYGAAKDDGLGAAVGGAGDVNGDGFDDLFAGAPAADPGGASSGEVRLVLGPVGNQSFTLPGTAAGDFYGEAVLGGLDVDGDGLADLAVGAPGSDLGGPNSGSVRITRGATGATLYTVPGPEPFSGFGGVLAAVADLDGDGRSELAVGAPFADQPAFDGGALLVLSGATGQTLFVLGTPVSFDEYGAAAAALGDTNGDGVADLCAGSPAADTAAGADAGAVEWLSADCPDVALVGAGCPQAAGGVPQIGLAGCAVGGAVATLSLGGAPMGFALLLVGVQPGPTPIGPNCQAEMALPAPLAIGPLPLGPTGLLELPALLPVPMPLLTLRIQAFVFDPAAPGTVAATPGLLLPPP